MTHRQDEGLQPLDPTGDFNPADPSSYSFLNKIAIELVRAHITCTSQ